MSIPASCIIRCIQEAAVAGLINRHGLLLSISAKNKVKRSKFEDKEDLATRITEACNSVPPNHFHVLVQHSVNVFEKCLNEEHI